MRKSGYLYGDFDLKSPLVIFTCNSNDGINGIFIIQNENIIFHLMEVGKEMI